ncbi:MAG TPA: hypothetical protein PKX93_03635 [bacterium]|nr:hypothetical protein [bacterium]
MGGQAVGLAVTTEDKVYCSLELRRHVEMMHQAGLKAIFVFGRWGGLFAAAAINSSSRETFKHPEWWKVGPDGKPPGCIVCCVNHPGFRRYFFEEAEHFFRWMEPDGLLMDEPKDANWPCYCQYCRSKGNPRQIHVGSLAAFLGEVARFFKKLRPGGSTYLFHMPGQPVPFYEETAAQEGLDYLGVDGPLCLQKKADGRVLSKTPLLESMKTVLPIVKKYGKKTLVVPENFLVPAGEEKVYAKNLRKLLQEKPDAVVFHYYGFGNENPALLMRKIEQVLRSLPSEKTPE